MPDLEKFEAFPDDIVIATFPKSGEKIEFHSSPLIRSLKILHFCCQIRMDKLESVTKLHIQYCSVMLSHFSPAPVKTDRTVRIQ